MSDSGTWIEIVLLAMLAGFIGLRLVSVLGKRTGSENSVVPMRGAAAGVPTAVANRAELPVRRPVGVPAGTSADVAPALQAIADADATFDPAKFLAGAQGAYRLVLDAFWAGDVATMTGWYRTRCSTIFASPSRTATAPCRTRSSRSTARRSSARGWSGRWPR